MADDGSGDRRLKAAFSALGQNDLADFVRRCGSNELDHIARLLKVRVDRGRIRGGVGLLVRSKWAKLTPNGRHLVGKYLARPVIERCVALLGPDRSKNPSGADLAEILDELLEEFSVPQVRFAFTYGVNQDYSAAAELAACLADDPRLRVDAPGASDGAAADASTGEGTDGPEALGDETPVTQGSEEAPEDDETLFTSLDRLLITTAVSTANGQLAAPTPDELVELTEELLSLNASRKHSYFHTGFVSALIDRELRVPAAGLNPERRQWCAFGRLSGLTRRGDGDALAKAALEDRGSTSALVRDAAMGASLTGPLVTALLSTDPAFAATLLFER